MAKLPLTQEVESWIPNGKSFAIFLYSQSAIHDPIADEYTIAYGATALILGNTLSVVKMKTNWDEKGLGQGLSYWLDNFCSLILREVGGV